MNESQNTPQNTSQNTSHQVCKINAVVPQGTGSNLLEKLEAIGVDHLHFSPGRSVILEERSGFFGLGSRTVTLGSQVDLFSFLIHPSLETKTLQYISQQAQLHQPGRGSVYSESVELIRAHGLCQEAQTLNLPDDLAKSYSPISSLTGICCIVQRGQGENLARAALEMGAGVPIIHFGRGTGLRNKMGLLRITIPSEKELLQVVTSDYLAVPVMNHLIGVGKLHLPGRGFIFNFPVGRGMINRKIRRDQSSHLASLDQIIAAIDEHYQGDTSWRHRTDLKEKRGLARGPWLENLVDLTLICDEGKGEELVGAAMEGGAGGATISLQKHITLPQTREDEVSRVREMCHMIVPQNCVDNLITVLDESGAFDDDAHGQLELRQVPRAFTWRHTGTVKG